MINIVWKTAGRQSDPETQIFDEQILPIGACVYDFMELCIIDHSFKPTCDSLNENGPIKS